MGKNKNKQELIPSPQSATNRDILHRLNFSYQASVFMTVMCSSAHQQQATERSDQIESGPVMENSHSSNEERRREYCERKKSTRSESHRKKKCMIDSANDLAREWSEGIRGVGRKTTVKMDPSVKRTICQKCHAIFIPGVTVSVRVKKSTSHRHAMVYTCLRCLTSRRIPAPPPPALAGDEDGTKTGHKMTVEDHSTQKRPIVGTACCATTKIPLFNRPDAGHFVFKGDEAVHPDDEGGSGLFGV